MSQLPGLQGTYNKDLDEVSDENNNDFADYCSKLPDNAEAYLTMETVKRDCAVESPLLKSNLDPGSHRSTSGIIECL